MLKLENFDQVGDIFSKNKKWDVMNPPQAPDSIRTDSENDLQKCSKSCIICATFSENHENVQSCTILYDS